MVLFPCNVIALVFSALLPNSQKPSKDTFLVMSFFFHKKLVLHAIWGSSNKECEKHSKYTHLVRLFCILIKSVIHEFQYFGILETSPYSRVFAFFALWFLWNYEHVSHNVLVFPNIDCFTSIFAFFVGNKLKNTQNIPFS